MISVTIVSTITNSRPRRHEESSHMSTVRLLTTISCALSTSRVVRELKTPVKHVSHYLFASGRDYSKQVIQTSCGEPLEWRPRSSNIPSESSARKCAGDAAVRVTVSEKPRTTRTGSRRCRKSTRKYLDRRTPDSVTVVGHFVPMNGRPTLRNSQS